MTRERLNALGAEILDACMEVHRELGSGLLESAYANALRAELKMRDIQSRTEVPIPLFYKGVDTGKHYKIDLLVEAEVIVEIKAVETLHPTCQSQIISHLTLANKPLGYLVNFNVVKLKDGFKRYVNNF